MPEDYDVRISGHPIQDVRCKVCPASFFSRLTWPWLRFTVKMTWVELPEGESFSMEVANAREMG